MTKDQAIQQAVEALEGFIKAFQKQDWQSGYPFVYSEGRSALDALRAAQSEPAPAQPVVMRSPAYWYGVIENEMYAEQVGPNNVIYRPAEETTIQHIRDIQAEALASANAKWENRRMEFHKFAYSTKAEMDALKDEIESLRLAASAAGIPQIPECHTLWLWKNGHYYLAYDNPYPCKTVGGDPLTLGEPSAYAVFKASVNGREEYVCPKLPRLPDSATDTATKDVIDYIRKEFYEAERRGSHPKFTKGLCAAMNFANEFRKSEGLPPYFSATGAGDVEDLPADWIILYVRRISSTFNDPIYECKLFGALGGAASRTINERSHTVLGAIAAARGKIGAG